ncbi:MAG: hypothetical protein ACR2IH_02695 [Pyrinomonadaceae bacterium]
MKNIVVIKDPNPDEPVESGKDIVVKELFKGPFRNIVEIRLRNDAKLSRHKATEPITVFCISGSGVFNAGSQMEESLRLRAGTLITLEPGVEHEVLSEPALDIIVTKFTGS